MPAPNASGRNKALGATPVEAVTFVFGPYTLDTRTKRLLHNGAVVQLTTKAFETLEVLVRAAGQTVTKDDLLKQVWPGTFVQEDTLAQNISTIRKKLGEKADSPVHVLTVPREGYRFVQPVEVVHGGAVVSDSEPHERGSILRMQKGYRRNIRRWLIPFTVGIGSGLVFAAVAFVRARPPSPPAATTFEVFEPDGARFSTSGGALALSPDGRQLAFLATDANQRDRLWIRSLDSRESRALAGTEDASQPFWSADGRSIAFFSRGALRTIDISGGDVRTIAQLSAGANAFAGTWSSQGLIVFPLSGKGLLQVRASGGNAAPLPLTGFDDCAECVWPFFLPDGRHFLFTLASARQDRGIYLASLDGTAPRRVLEDASSTAFTSDGYLVYAAAGALVARRFDPSRGEFDRDIVPLADHVWVNPTTTRATFSASTNGVIAYREPLTTRLRWISRSGDVISSGPEGLIYNFRISRTGRIVLSQLDPQRGTYDLWLHDPEWKSQTRLTFDAALKFTFVWSGDGTSVAFARDRGRDGWQLYEMNVDKPGVEHPLLSTPAHDELTPIAWKDETLYFADYTSPGHSSRVWSIQTGGHETLPPAAVTQWSEDASPESISPDATSLAYAAPVTDSRPPHNALFMRPWPNGAGRSQITSEGSTPRWSADGRELFFLAPNGQLMAEQIHDGRISGAPVSLCSTEAVPTTGLAGDAYDAAPDGLRFLVKVPARRPSIVVVSGWLAGRSR